MLSPQQRRCQIRGATPPAIVTSEIRLPEKPKRGRKPAPTKAIAPPAPAELVAPATEPRTAPLSLFKQSDLNVRKFYRDDDVAEMAAQIEAFGLLQNLCAVPDDDDGKFAVTAGGRRLKALWLLQEQGKIDGDYEVAFQLVAPEDGRELSLMENASRVALNPVEEIEAYARIVADHHGQPDPLTFAANRQGTTRAYVEGMLRLNCLATEIMDALRAGRIDLGAARAYATTTDQEVQLQVFHAEERRIHGTSHKATEIRSALRGRSYPVDGPEAVYVGLDVYRAAGGRIEPELLFGTESVDRLLDRALLERLARQRAEDEANVCAIEQGMSGGVLVLVFSQKASWPRPPAGYATQHGLVGERLAALDPERQKRAIGVYNLKDDGTGLVLEGVMTPIAMPAATPAPLPPPLEEQIVIARPASAPTLVPPIAAKLPTLPRDHEPEAVDQRLRDQAIRRRAAALAAKGLLQAAWPGQVGQSAGEERTALSADLLADGDVRVTIQLIVHRDEIDAQRAIAAAEVDAKLAEVAA